MTATKPSKIANGTVLQSAALPITWKVAKTPRVLMITSRETGRWVMPKGWLMDGRKPWHAAEIEALEEAGAVGAMGSDPIGEYSYDKKLDDGAKILVRVRLYPLVVEHLKKRWKEREERQRRWFSFKSAARRVGEPELREILLSLANKPHKQPAIRRLLKHC